LRVVPNGRELDLYLTSTHSLVAAGEADTRPELSDPRAMMTTSGRPMSSTGRSGLNGSGTASRRSDT
jgi:hypothetical protein